MTGVDFYGPVQVADDGEMYVFGELLPLDVFKRSQRLRRRGRPDYLFEWAMYQKKKRELG